MNERFETRVWHTRHEELVRDAARRQLARAMRAEDRARCIERRVGDRRAAGGGEGIGEGTIRTVRGGPAGGGWRGLPALWGLTPVPFFKVGAGGAGREGKAS